MLVILLLSCSYIIRLLWLLDEYVSKVDTTTDVSIETENINLRVVENINLRVVNHTHPESGFTYAPVLIHNNRSIEVHGQ